MGLTSIVGNYDAVLVPLLLDKNVVLSFLPPFLRDDLCVFDAKGILEGVELPENKHPVFFLLGRQNKCGPWMLPSKMSFQEAKLEIPFVRHTASGSDAPHSYKSTVIFDSHMMAMSSQHIAGLRSRYATFDPPRYLSSTMKNDTGDVIYAIDGVLELRRSQGNEEEVRSSDASGSGAAAWSLNESMVKELLGFAWFGEGTGKSAQRFMFDWAGAAHSPEPIKVDLAFYVDWFSAAPRNEPRGWKSASDWTVVKGVTAFEFCAHFTSV